MASSLPPGGAGRPGRRRARVWLAPVCLLAVVVTALAVEAAPADPEARLPRRYRLADLIAAEQDATSRLRAEAEALRAAVEREQAAASARAGTLVDPEELRAVAAVAGLSPVRGPGLRVTLTDAVTTVRGGDTLPDGATVNDLVIHSQDVQAVVNALWRSGAEAVSINGQRLIGTSAVLCVGNTLLLNGTVHSPPYVVSAVGATRERFDADRLVRRLRQHASAFGIGVDVERVADLELPAYTGSTKLAHARPAET